MASDHLSIDDSVYDELREHYSEAQIVELGMWAAFCVGFGRLAATWHMVEELPEAFKDTSRPLSPWCSARTARECTATPTRRPQPFSWWNTCSPRPSPPSPH